MKHKIISLSGILWILAFQVFTFDLQEQASKHTIIVNKSTFLYERCIYPATLVILYICTMF